MNEMPRLQVVHILNLMVPVSLVFFGWYMSSRLPKNDANCLFKDSTRCKPHFFGASVRRVQRTRGAKGVASFFFSQFSIIIVFFSVRKTAMMSVLDIASLELFLYDMFFLCHVWFSISH